MAGSRGRRRAAAPHVRAWMHDGHDEQYGHARRRRTRAPLRHANPHGTQTSALAADHGRGTDAAGTGGPSPRTEPTNLATVQTASCLLQAGTLGRMTTARCHMPDATPAIPSQPEVLKTPTRTLLLRGVAAAALPSPSAPTLGPWITQRLLPSSPSGNAVTDCCWLPLLYATWCEWSRCLVWWCISLMVLPHVTCAPTQRVRQQGRTACRCRVACSPGHATMRPQATGQGRRSRRAVAGTYDEVVSVGPGALLVDGEHHRQQQGRYLPRGRAAAPHLVAAALQTGSQERGESGGASGCRRPQLHWIQEPGVRKLPLPEREQDTSPKRPALEPSSTNQPPPRGTKGGVPIMMTRCCRHSTQPSAPLSRAAIVAQLLQTGSLWSPACSVFRMGTTVACTYSNRAGGRRPTPSASCAAPAKMTGG